MLPPSPSTDSRPRRDRQGLSSAGAGAQSSRPPHQSEELMRRNDAEGTLRLLRRCTWGHGPLRLVQKLSPGFGPSVLRMFPTFRSLLPQVFHCGTALALHALVSGSLKIPSEEIPSRYLVLPQASKDQSHRHCCPQTAGGINMDMNGRRDQILTPAQLRRE